MIRGNALQGHIIKSGRFDWLAFRRRKSGTLLEMDRGSFRNGMTTQGLTAALAAELSNGTRVSTWYMGLVNNSGFSAFDPDDTMASHAGWSELTEYDEATRETLVFGAPAGGVVATSAFCEFTINATVAIKGAFITSVATKADNTGILRATGAFTGGSVLNFADDGVLQLSYVATNTAG